VIKIFASIMGSLWGILGIVFVGLLLYGLVTGTDPRDIGTSHRTEKIQER
jgi:hypothetical protein